MRVGYRAIYAYAWNLAEIRTPSALDRFCSLGLDTVTIAGSYHAGKFLRPHVRRGKVHFPEDVVVDFAPDPKRYGAIKPVPHSMVAAFWLADTRTDGELAAFLTLRCDIVTRLVREVRQSVRSSATVSVIPSVARPTCGAWYEGSDLKGLAEAAGIIEACLYEPGVGRIKADLHDIKLRLRGVGTLRGILRPAFPDLEAKTEFLAAMRSLGAGGLGEVAFYNWGHLRDVNLDWIPEGLVEMEAAA
jgi:hypothetical protein